MASSQSESDKKHAGQEGAAHRPLRIGGMALGNGLFVHSPRFWAAAVREDDGGVRVASGAKRFGRTSEEGRVPLFRGLARLADGLMVMVPMKRALPSAVLPFEEPRVQAAVVVAALTGLGLRGGGGNPFRHELQVMFASLAPLMVALRGSELAAYHGAEHKSIGEYEIAVSLSGGSPSAASPSGATSSPHAGSAPAATKEHERCGSNVVGPLLATSFVSNLALRTLYRRPHPGVALASGLVSLGAAMEIFRWMSRHPHEPFSRALAWPGQVLQESITTKEPSEAQMEVARAAVAELLSHEGAPAA